MRRARAADVSPAVARGMMASTIRHAAAKMATTSRCGKTSRREQRNRKNNNRLQIHSPKIMLIARRQSCSMPPGSQHGTHSCAHD